MIASRVEHTSTTGVLFSGSGKVTSIAVCANGGASNCQIYDGIGTTGQLLYNIGLLDGAGFSPNLGEGVQFYVGVYVVCADANIKVTIGMLPDGI